jgi:hypothetical protein
MDQVFQLRRSARAVIGFVILTCVNLCAASGVTHPFEGVTCIDRTETIPREIHMHIVQIDLATPGLRFIAKTIPAYASAAHPDALLTPGGPNNYSDEKSWYDVLQARTAIGLSRDNGSLTLFSVDLNRGAVRGGSQGLKVGEVADILMNDYNVWNALNLDGGGSTTMAMEDPVSHLGVIVNTSSDNPAGRSVASSLAVFARRRPVQ